MVATLAYAKHITQPLHEIFEVLLFFSLLISPSFQPRVDTVYFRSRHSNFYVIVKALENQQIYIAECMMLQSTVREDRPFSILSIFIC